MNCLVELNLGMTWNRTARTSRLTHDPQRMLACRKYLKQQIFITVKDTMSVCYGLMTKSSSRLTTFRLWYSSSLSKTLSRDTTLKKNYANTILENLEKCYLNTVPDAHKVEQRSDEEWYLPHHPIINPNRPGKVRSVLNGAAKFHGTSLKKPLLTGPELLQNLIHVLLRFRQHQFSVSTDIEGMFLQVGVPECDQPSLRFLWREYPTKKL